MGWWRKMERLRRSSGKERGWEFKLWQSVWRKSDVLGLLGVLERERRDSEGSWEEFWWKKGIRWVGLAYRELIGSLYESWTIGIGRVCKKLINSLIQQCQKCQKWGFEAKEKESSPRSHTLLFGDFSQGEGECRDGKEKE